MKEKYKPGNCKDFEVIFLADASKVKRRSPHDYRRWPKLYRSMAETAIKKKLSELPAGAKIVYERSRCDLRVDLSEMPWQFYRSIKVELPA